MTFHPALAVLMLPLTAAAFVAGLVLVRKAARQYGWSAELQRKIIHVATGLFAMAMPWLLPQPWLVYAMLLVALAVMAVLRTPWVIASGVGAALHGVERKSWGDVMLVAAIGTLYFFSDEASKPVLYLLPLAILTLADAAAAVTGTNYGRLRYAIEDGEKSLEGSVIFLMVAWIVALIALLLLSDVPRFNVVMLSLMTAAFATIIEADSWRGFDNYFVPVAVLFLILKYMESSPLTLLGLAAGFFVTLTLMRIYGGALFGFSRHTARAYTAALFMIGAVAPSLNMLLPASTLFSQGLARRWNAGGARHPDLDMLIMLAVISFMALICGEVLGPSAISFYQIACAGIVLQFLMLALANRPAWLRAVSAIGACSILLILVPIVISFNPEADRWHGPILPVVVAGLFVSLLVSYLRPAFYFNYRYIKVGTIASAIPATTYLIPAT